MQPQVQFVFYLLAFIAFVIAAMWPAFKREPASPLTFIATGLALVTLVWLWQAGHAAF